jgi:hypothetical protein
MLRISFWCFLICLGTETLEVIFRRGLPEGFMGGLFPLAFTVLTAVFSSQEQKKTPMSWHCFCHDSRRA